MDPEKTAKRLNSIINGKLRIGFRFDWCGVKSLEQIESSHKISYYDFDYKKDRWCRYTDWKHHYDFYRTLYPPKYINTQDFWKLNFMYCSEHNLFEFENFIGNKEIFTEWLVMFELTNRIGDAA